MIARRRGLASLGLAVLLLALLDYVTPRRCSSCPPSPRAATRRATSRRWPSCATRCCPPAASARLVPRRVPRTPPAALLLPAPVPGHVARWPRWSVWPSRSSSAPSSASSLLPLLAYAAFRLMGFRSRAAARRRGRVRLPVLRGEPDLGRHPGQHAHRRVLLHVRHRPRARSSSAPPTGAYARGDGPWVPAVAARGHRARPRLRGALGGPVRRRTSSTPRAVPRARWAGWPAWPASPSRWPPSGCCPLLADWGWTTPYDDPWITVGLRNLFPSVPVAALRGRRGRGGLDAAPRAAGGRARPPAAVLLHSALVAIALAAAGAHARHHRHPLHAVRAARALPGRSGHPRWPCSAWPPPTWPRSRSSSSASCTRTPTRRCCGPGWTGTTPALQAKELWPAFSRAHRAAARVRRRSARRRRIQQPARARRLHPHVRDAAVLLRPLDPRRASTTRPACRRTPSTTWPRSSAPPLRTRSASATIRSSTPTAALAPPAPVRRRAGRRPQPEAGGQPGRAPRGAARGPRPSLRRVRPRGGRGAATSSPGLRAGALLPAGLGATSRTGGSRASRSRARTSSSPTIPASTVVEKDEWLAPPEVPLPAGVTAQARLEDEAITVTTSRVGHPLLVKVSYHPRWRAEGADGPWLVSPALMMIVPRQPTVRLTYGAHALRLRRPRAHHRGRARRGGLLVRRRRRRGAPRPRAHGRSRRSRSTTAPRCPRPPAGGEPPSRPRCSSCLGARLWRRCVDAAARRDAALRERVAGLRGGPLRGRRRIRPARSSRARGGRATARGAARPARREPDARRPARGGRGAFDAVLAEPEPNPLRRAGPLRRHARREAAGDPEAARAAREHLLRDFADSPWARRALQEPGEAGDPAELAIRAPVSPRPERGDARPGSRRWRGGAPPRAPSSSRTGMSWR